MDRLTQLHEAAIRWLRWIAIAGFAAGMIGAAIITLDSLLRTFANSPIRGLAEIIDIATATVIATSFPIGLAQRRNISIRLLNGKLGKAGNLALELFTSTVLLVFVVIVAFELVAYTIEAARLGERSLVLRIPAAPFWIATSMILCLSVPAQLLITTIDAMRLIKGETDGGADPRLEHTPT